DLNSAGIIGSGGLNRQAPASSSVFHAGGWLRKRSAHTVARREQKRPKASGEKTNAGGNGGVRPIRPDPQSSEPGRPPTRRPPPPVGGGAARAATPEAQGGGKEKRRNKTARRKKNFFRRPAAGGGPPLLTVLWPRRRRELRGSASVAEEPKDLIEELAVLKDD